MAVISRMNALSKYYKNPNLCKYCGEIIHVGGNNKVSQIKIKKFCNLYCSSKFNNIKRVKPKIIKEKYVCPISSLDNTKRYYKEKYVGNWWLARVPIAKAAKKVYLNSSRPRRCEICGYDKHYEVCHIKTVSEFEDSATLREINSLSNMVALCRNCHWEFDNNLIELQNISGCGEVVS